MESVIWQPEKAPSSGFWEQQAKTPQVKRVQELPHLQSIKEKLRQEIRDNCIKYLKDEIKFVRPDEIIDISKLDIDKVAIAILDKSTGKPTQEEHQMIAVVAHGIFTARGADAFVGAMPQIISTIDPMGKDAEQYYSNLAVFISPTNALYHETQKDRENYKAMPIDVALRMILEIPPITEGLAVKVLQKYGTMSDAPDSDARFQKWIIDEFVPYEKTVSPQAAEPYRFGDILPIRGAPNFFDGRPGLFDDHPEQSAKLELESRQAILEAAGRTGLPSEFIAAALLQEGYVLVLNDPTAELNLSALGMDTFPEEFNKIGSPLRQYLPANFSEGKNFNAISHSNLKINDIIFKTCGDQVAAFAAMLKVRFDRANSSSKTMMDDHLMMAYAYYTKGSTAETAREVKDKISHAQKTDDLRTMWYWETGRVMATYHYLEASGVFK